MCVHTCISFLVRVFLCLEREHQQLFQTSLPMTSLWPVSELHRWCSSTNAHCLTLSQQPLGDKIWKPGPAVAQVKTALGWLFSMFRLVVLKCPLFWGTYRFPIKFWRIIRTLPSRDTEAFSSVSFATSERWWTWLWVSTYTFAWVDPAWTYLPSLQSRNSL